MNFTRLLRRVSRRYPNNDAVIEGDRTASFEQFWQSIGAVGSLYRELGVGAGDRALLVIPNSLEFLVFHFAALKIGAISVPVKPEYRARELDQIVEDCRPRLLVSTDRWLAENAAVLSLPREVRTVSVGRLASDSPPSDDLIYPASSEEVASINYCYTGDGRPKGAMLTHANHICAATGYARHQGFRPSDRFLIILPMAHVYALSGCVNSGLIRGAALVIVPESRPKSIFRAIERHGITILSAVPVIFECLADFPWRGRYDLSSLRLSITGGDYLPERLQRDFAAALGVQMVQGYGLTECLPIICNPPSPRNKPGTLGVPGRRDIEIRIVSDAQEPLPPGQTGIIAVRSPTTMKGYYRRAEETRQILRDGWLLTGDLGWLDTDGYLHFQGKVKNVLNVYGNKVDPQEVSDTLREHPSICEARVYAEQATTPSRIMGAMTVCASVTLSPNCTATEAEIRQFLRERLAAFKVPKKITLRHRSLSEVHQEPSRDGAI